MASNPGYNYNANQGSSAHYYMGMDGAGFGPPPPQVRDPNLHGGGCYSSQRRQSSMNAIYNAFEDYERMNRQRKFLAAEYEDKIGTLQKSLTEMSASNKDMMGECEKLEMEAQAYEAIYAKNLKEKALIENEYRTLSNEMDSVTAEVNRKKTQLLQIKMLHQEKVALAEKTQNAYLDEYMKNPAIAQVLDSKQKLEELEVDVQQKSYEFNEQCKEFMNMKGQLSGEWDVYVKKCVKMAEVHVELKKKKKRCATLRTEVELAVTANSGIKRPTTLAGVSSSGIGVRQMDRLSERLIGVSVPKKLRSSTFEQMDVIFGNSIRGFAGERRALGRDSPFTGNGVRNSSPLGSSLVSELKSRLKDTVRVTPMPRNSDASSSRPQIQAPLKPVGVAPTRNEIENQSIHKPIQQHHSQEIAFAPRPRAQNPVDIVDINSSQREKQMNFEATPRKDFDNDQSEIRKPSDFGINNTTVASNPRPTNPQAQQVAGNPLTGFNFNAQSPPDNQPFDMFGGNFNLNSSPPQSTQGGLDFFGGLFGPGPTTQQATGNDNFFLF